MFKIAPGPSWLLHGSTQTKSLEANSRNLLPANTLMQRAGLASARLTLALAPHAQTIWIACGPGNNGGDGLGPPAICTSGAKPSISVGWVALNQHQKIPMLPTSGY